MKIWTFVLVFLFTGLLNAQTKHKEELIEMNSIFTLKLTETNEGYDYSLINKKPYNQILDLKKLQNLFTESKPGEIQGILAYTKIGDEVNSFLILQSGLKSPLKYDLYIKKHDVENVEKASVVNVFPGILSTEIWPSRIDYIVFSNFDDVMDN